MGIAVSFYHAYGEITFTLNACTLSKAFSCESVFASGYTSFLHVDFWIYGVVWFPLCLALGLWSINKYGGPKRSILVPFLMVGNIWTLIPWNIEIRILAGTYCPVCITLYCINYLLTVVALLSGPSAEADL
jgi:uncharacterized membrane protein